MLLIQQKKNILRKWNNNILHLYINKIISVYSNLNEKSYIKNDYLLNEILSKNINPEDIAKLSVYNTSKKLERIIE